MDFSVVGTAGQYAKRLSLQTRWNLKKQSGDWNGHKNSLNDYLSVSSHQEEEKAESDKMAKISAKIQAGVRLSKEEMEYLREKNPMLYEKIRSIHREQKEYEKELRRCKSKMEAHQLHMCHTARALEAAKEGDAAAAYRMSRVNESTTEFKKSKEYRDLPLERKSKSDEKKTRGKKRGRERSEEAEKPDLRAGKQRKNQPVFPGIAGKEESEKSGKDGVKKNGRDGVEKTGQNSVEKTGQDGVGNAEKTGEISVENSVETVKTVGNGNKWFYSGVETGASRKFNIDA